MKEVVALAWPVNAAAEAGDEGRVTAARASPAAPASVRLRRIEREFMAMLRTCEVTWDRPGGKLPHRT
jgi:hypothetical protein